MSLTLVPPVSLSKKRLLRPCRHPDTIRLIERQATQILAEVTGDGKLAREGKRAG
jgi:hypothetical protein